MQVKDLLGLDPETEIVLWHWNGDTGKYYIANLALSQERHPHFLAVVVNLCRAYEITEDVKLDMRRKNGIINS
jgi:hypothetical protein